MRPDVCETADELYESLGALTAQDEELGWPLLLFCDAICSATLERVSEVSADRDDGMGWIRIFDPDNSPAYALPYLGQFVGVQLQSELSEADQRAKITVPEGWQRGTVDALISAVKRTLTDTQTIIFKEREPSAYQLAIRTLIDETPDEAATLRAILTQKPIGIVLDYEAIPGQTWADLAAAYADWDAVSAAFTDWDEVTTTPP